MTDKRRADRIADALLEPAREEQRKSRWRWSERDRVTRARVAVGAFAPLGMFAGALVGHFLKLGLFAPAMVGFIVGLLVGQIVYRRMLASKVD